MSQTYTANCYQSDHVAVTDMANIEANFATLRSNNSGASAPANTEAGLLWFDTSTGAGTEGLLKVRNDADSAWLAVLCGSASQKLWIYRNDSDDGWAIDATVTDRVIALKGGSGLYNANGGTNAGETWANLKAHTHPIGSHTHLHNHQWYNSALVTENDRTWDSGGSEIDLVTGSNKTSGAVSYIQKFVENDSRGTRNLGDAYTANDSTAPSASPTAAQSTADVRPQAALGTLQYPDI